MQNANDFEDQYFYLREREREFTPSSGGVSLSHEMEK